MHENQGRQMPLANCLEDGRRKQRLHSKSLNERFYEKVNKVKADVAALLTFLVLCGFRHISAETFALGSLRSDDWQLATHSTPAFVCFPRIECA
jgi:hypothetical protein